MADFGFVGPSYTTPSRYVNAEECINFFLEIDPTKQLGQNGVVALYPTPGLVLTYQLATAPIRGMRALSGGKYMMAVAGIYVYIINNNGNVTQVGTLTSNATATNPVSITDTITAQGLVAYLADGVNRYYWIAATGSFQTLPTTDGPWVGAQVVDQVDGYVIYNQAGTQNWGASDLNSQFSTNAYYGSKNGSSDNLVSVVVDRRNVFLLGENTTEVWIDVGNTINGIITFPFSRIQGTSMQHGIAAPYSIARFAEQFMFVSKDTRGQSVIGAIQGYQFIRLSTHAVEYSLLGQVVSDAIAYSYQLEGHEFYVVTFPTANITWVYDLTTKFWHKWLSLNSATNTLNRHRSNCGCFFNNNYYVGDYANGQIYALDNNTYTEAGNTIKRIRRATHLVSDYQRQYFAELQIRFEPGVGLNFVPVNPAITSVAGLAIAGTAVAGTPIVAVPGAVPKAMLRWSNDGGSTFSNEHWTSIGQIGQYKNRAIWRRLGYARDRIFEVTITDPVKAVIVAANLKAEVGDN